MRIISAEKKARKPSDTLFKAAAAAAGAKGISPSEVRVRGPGTARDIEPAKKHGFRTALFEATPNTDNLSATPEQTKKTRPKIRVDAFIKGSPQSVELIS